MSQQVQVACEDCGHQGVARLGQTVFAGQLLWSRSIQCPNGCAIEEDGHGFPPERVRVLLLEDGGWWDVLAADADRVVLLKAIRELFGLSMEEALARGRAFPQAFRGTRTEAEWLQEKLSESHIVSEMKRSAEP